MITLASDCLVFQLASGENVPFSPDMVSVELMGETARWFDPDFVRDAAKAVFHYFKHEKGRQTVTVGEFAEALEQVLSGFNAPAKAGEAANSPSRSIGADLSRLAQESGPGGELAFFPRLRREVRQQVQNSPQLMHFSGLRDCVKQLAGAQRWGERCRSLEEQIVVYLRECLTAETPAGKRTSLVVR